MVPEISKLVTSSMQWLLHESNHFFVVSFLL